MRSSSLPSSNFHHYQSYPTTLKQHSVLGCAKNLKCNPSPLELDVHLRAQTNLQERDSTQTLGWYRKGPMEQQNNKC